MSLSLPTPKACGGVPPAPQPTGGTGAGDDSKRSLGRVEACWRAFNAWKVLPGLVPPFQPPRHPYKEGMRSIFGYKGRLVMDRGNPRVPMQRPVPDPPKTPTPAQGYGFWRVFQGFGQGYKGQG
ncbi:hypothetical protein BKA70DRAFT_1229847 [Coprinopsis sp. MPI-PUGE-AT-0042]|nr:hypothetical protein BKA70DRAFT_1229847 [Coprinopsis sp. MPI-PUGE-AT-0042]